MKENYEKTTRDFISRRRWISIEEWNQKLPARPGIYVVRSGRCISHIGKSGNIKRRVSQLARLTTHRGSAEVLCVAYCTQKPPQIYYEIMSPSKGTIREETLKKTLGEPPTPRSKYESCKDGRELRIQLLENADRRQAGYIEAIFDVGELLRNVFRPNFQRVWKTVRKPPGWKGFVYKSR